MHFMPWQKNTITFCGLLGGQAALMSSLCPSFPFLQFSSKFPEEDHSIIAVGCLWKGNSWSWSIYLHHQNCWVMGFVHAVLCSSVSEIMLGKKDSKNSLQASVLEVIVCTLWQFFAPPHCHLPLSSLFSKLIICRHVWT